MAPALPARAEQYVFLVAGIVSFVSAFLAGLGGRLLGSGHLEIATMAAVLLLVPGVAVLNAQLDAIDGKPNLAAARSLRIAYLLLFMTLGLVVAQHMVALVPHESVRPSLAPSGLFRRRRGGWFCRPF